MSAKLAQFLHQDRFQTATMMLNVPEVRQSVDEFICLLFPQRGCHSSRGMENTQERLEELKTKFTSYVDSVSTLDEKIKGRAAELVESFLNDLPSLAQTLDTDADAAFQGDPAAYSREEVIITYPGFYAICIHRLAHTFYHLGVPLLPRLMSEYAHEKTGIDIHPGAQIGPSVFIDHGTGVVIGETAIIGKNVKIYQGVTLGALSVKKKYQNKKRHPTIEDDVVIYASSTILGGETIVGQGSIIGGNTWITESVAPKSVVFNKPEAR